MDRLARVMFLLLCHVTSLVKQIVFHADAARIDLLVDGLDGEGDRGAEAGLAGRTLDGATRLPQIRCSPGEARPLRARSWASARA